MTPTEYLLHSLTATVDVELPLRRASAVDVDLPLQDAAAASHRAAGTSFHPSLSQLAADLSLARIRWPHRSRSGYHGASSGNWMRDGRVGFGDRTIPGY